MDKPSFLQQLYEELNEKESSAFVLHNPYAELEPKDYTSLTKNSKVQDGFHYHQKNKHKRKGKK